VLLELELELEPSLLELEVPLELLLDELDLLRFFFAGCLVGGFFCPAGLVPAAPPLVPFFLPFSPPELEPEEEPDPEELLLLFDFLTSIFLSSPFFFSRLDDYDEEDDDPLPPPPAPYFYFLSLDPEACFF
jgi:hypothetical protein